MGWSSCTGAPSGSSTCSLEVPLCQLSRPVSDVGSPVEQKTFIANTGLMKKMDEPAVHFADLSSVAAIILCTLALALTLERVKVGRTHVRDVMPPSVRPARPCLQLSLSRWPGACRGRWGWSYDWLPRTARYALSLVRGGRQSKGLRQLSHRHLHSYASHALFADNSPFPVAWGVRVRSARRHLSGPPFEIPLQIFGSPTSITPTHSPFPTSSDYTYAVGCRPEPKNSPE